jgi:hypothetical protein
MPPKFEGRPRIERRSQSAPPSVSPRPSAHFKPIDFREEQRSPSPHEVRVMRASPSGMQQERQVATTTSRAHEARAATPSPTLLDVFPSHVMRKHFSIYSEKSNTSKKRDKEAFKSSGTALDRRINNPNDTFSQNTHYSLTPRRAKQVARDISQQTTPIRSADTRARVSSAYRSKTKDVASTVDNPKQGSYRMTFDFSDSANPHHKKTERISSIPQNQDSSSSDSDDDIQASSKKNAKKK